MFFLFRPFIRNRMYTKFSLYDEIYALVVASDVKFDSSFPLFFIPREDGKVKKS